MNYDVVVVGAGPAGSTAAKILAENGVNVLLVDKKRFPRDKPCGGGLPVRALKRFSYLRNSDLIESYCYGGYVYYSDLDYKAELVRSEPVLAMVRREKFDHGLVQLAVKSGAHFVEEKSVVDVQFFENNVVVVFDDGSQVAADMVIGADGIWSTIARKSGLCPTQRPVSICIFKEYSLPGSALDEFFTEKRLCHIFIRFQEIVGYGWVFPKKDCVNIGIDEVRIDYRKHDSKQNLKEAFRKYFVLLQENKIIPLDLEMGSVRGAALPIFPLKKTYSDRMLLCGDAAGFLNPITGEGLYYAMASGELAAGVAIKALAVHDVSARFLSRYQKVCDTDFCRDLRLFVRVNRRWGSHVKSLFRVVVSDKRLCDMILDVGTGQVGAVAYRGKLLRRFVFVVFKYLLKRKKSKKNSS